MNNLIFSEKDFLNTYKKRRYGYKALEKCKKNNWLPVKPSPFLASIVGRLMGDGNLSKDRMVGDFRFYGYPTKLDKIKEDIKNKFNLIPYSYYPHPKGGGYILKYNNAIFSRILELIGAPRGNKILINFEVPKWIMEGNKKIKKAFLSALFADDMGKINKNSYGQWCGGELRLSKVEDKFNCLMYFLNQIKEMLNGFGINSSEVKRKSLIYYRKDGYITNQAGFCLSLNLLNRKRFYHNVGFDDEEKQKLLYSSF